MGEVIVEPQKVEDDRPVPYVADMSPLGLMTIKWNKPMKPLSNIEEIPPTKIAVDEELFR